MKKTYKYLSIAITFTALLFTQFSVNAQQNRRGEMREKMQEKVKAQKIAFITTELDLSVEEAQQFWPIYNDNEAKKEGLKSKYSKPNPNMSESEAIGFLEDHIKMKQEEIDLQRAYINKLQGVIAADKIVTLLHVEQRFKEELMRKLKQKMRDKRRP